MTRLFPILFLLASLCLACESYADCGSCAPRGRLRARQVQVQAVQVQAPDKSVQQAPSEPRLGYRLRPRNWKVFNR